MQEIQPQEIQANPQEKKKRTYVMTDKRKAAFEKMQEKRKQKIAEKRACKPIKVESKIINDTQEETSVNKSNDSSSGTDSSNYESDKDIQPIIINNYDKDEPDAKIKITKVKRKINRPELKKIYDEVKNGSLDTKVEKNNNRKQILDEYFENNKNKFCDPNGELDEFELSKSEFNKIKKRFLEYEKMISINN